MTCGLQGSCVYQLFCPNITCMQLYIHYNFTARRFQIVQCIEPTNQFSISGGGGGGGINNRNDFVDDLGFY